MKSHTLALRIAGTLFGFFCLVHVWRVLAGAEITIGQHHFAPSLSIIGAVIAGLLSLWFWKLSLDQS